MKIIIMKDELESLAFPPLAAAVSTYNKFY